MLMSVMKWLLMFLLACQTRMLAWLCLATGRLDLMTELLSLTVTSCQHRPHSMPFFLYIIVIVNENWCSFIHDYTVLCYCIEKIWSNKSCPQILDMCHYMSCVPCIMGHIDQQVVTGKNVILHKAVHIGATYTCS